MWHICVLFYLVGESELTISPKMFLSYGFKLFHIHSHCNGSMKHNLKQGGCKQKVHSML